MYCPKIHFQLWNCLDLIILSFRIPLQCLEPKIIFQCIKYCHPTRVKTKETKFSKLCCKWKLPLSLQKVFKLPGTWVIVVRIPKDLLRMKIYELNYVLNKIEKVTGQYFTCSLDHQIHNPLMPPILIINQQSSLSGPIFMHFSMVWTHQNVEKPKKGGLVLPESQSIALTFRKDQAPFCFLLMSCKILATRESLLVFPA